MSVTSKRDTTMTLSKETTSRHAAQPRTWSSACALFVRPCAFGTVAGGLDNGAARLGRRAPYP
jgi:hypothetical protein